MSNLLRALFRRRLHTQAVTFGALAVSALSGIAAGTVIRTSGHYLAPYFGMAFALLAMLTSQTALCGSVLQNGAFRNFCAAGWRKSQIFCAFLLDAVIWAIPAAVLFVLPFALLSANVTRLCDPGVVAQGCLALGMMLVFAIVLCTVLMLIKQQTAPALLLCIGCIGALLIAGYSVRKLISSGNWSEINPNKIQPVLQIGQEPDRQEQKRWVRNYNLQSPLREPVIVLHQLNPLVPLFDYEEYTHDPGFREELAADPTLAARRPWAAEAVEWDALMIDGAPRCQLGMLLLTGCIGLVFFRRRDIQ